jgi:hypothetical protein
MGKSSYRATSNRPLASWPSAVPTRLPLLRTLTHHASEHPVSELDGCHPCADLNRIADQPRVKEIRPFGKTIVRSAIIFLVLLLSPLSLPNAASAHPMSLYGPWDQPHEDGGLARSITSHDVLAGCGRGRYRDPATRQCKGPADVR